MVKKDVKKYLVVAALLIIAYITFLIISPFISAIITSFVLAYLFYPLHKKISKLTKNEIVGATLTTAIITIIMLLPLAYIANSLITESINLYRQGIIEETTTKLSSYLSQDPTLANIANEVISKLVIYFKQKATDFVSNIPSRLFELLITIYTTFGCLIYGKRVLNKTKQILPVKKKDQLVKDIGKTTHAIVYGLFLTALIEFIISLIVFKIIGTPAALILALIIGFLAFIPFLGPTIIWAPYAIIEAIRGNYTNVTLLIILGIILFIMETFVKSKIIGDRSRIHPVIILIGTIGGIKLFGFIGLVAGPVILSAIAEIIEEYYPEIDHET